MYLPDLLAVASFYKDWAKWGGGLSGQNVMSYGDFPDIPNDYSNKSMLLPSGVILGGDRLRPADVADLVNQLTRHEAAAVMSMGKPPRLVRRTSARSSLRVA